VDTPRPSPRTNRTRRVPHPVLIGHAASLTPLAAAGQAGASVGHAHQGPSGPRAVVLRVLADVDAAELRASDALLPEVPLLSPFFVSCGELDLSHKRAPSFIRERPPLAHTRNSSYGIEPLGDSTPFSGAEHAAVGARPPRAFAFPATGRPGWMGRPGRGSPRAAPAGRAGDDGFVRGSHDGFVRGSQVTGCAFDEDPLTADAARAVLRRARAAAHAPALSALLRGPGGGAVGGQWGDGAEATPAERAAWVTAVAATCLANEATCLANEAQPEGAGAAGRGGTAARAAEEEDAAERAAAGAAAARAQAAGVLAGSMGSADWQVRAAPNVSPPSPSILLPLPMSLLYTPLVDKS